MVDDRDRRDGLRMIGEFIRHQSNLQWYLFGFYAALSASLLLGFFSEHSTMLAKQAIGIAGLLISFIFLLITIMNFNTHHRWIGLIQEKQQELFGLHVLPIKEGKMQGRYDWVAYLMYSVYGIFLVLWLLLAICPKAFTETQATDSKAGEKICCVQLDRIPTKPLPKNQVTRLQK